MLKLFGDDSYVLGRLIYTLGIVMLSASNIPVCMFQLINFWLLLCMNIKTVLNLYMYYLKFS